VGNAVRGKTNQAAQQPVNDKGSNDNNSAVDPECLIEKNGLKMT
jgi:hypothetical protein